jgi:hypothetical protein
MVTQQCQLIRLRRCTIITRLGSPWSFCGMPNGGLITIAFPCWWFSSLQFITVNVESAGNRDYRLQPEIRTRGSVESIRSYVDLNEIQIIRLATWHVDGQYHQPWINQWPLLQYDRPEGWKPANGSSYDVVHIDQAIRVFPSRLPNSPRNVSKLRRILGLGPARLVQVEMTWFFCFSHHQWTNWMRHRSCRK